MKKRNICPHCGNESMVYTKQDIKGKCQYYEDMKGNNEREEVERMNSNIHDNVSYKYTSVYVFCAKCDKRLWKREVK